MALLIGMGFVFGVLSAVALLLGFALAAAALAIVAVVATVRAALGEH